MVNPSRVFRALSRTSTNESTKSASSTDSNESTLSSNDSSTPEQQCQIDGREGWKWSKIRASYVDRAVMCEHLSQIFGGHDKFELKMRHQRYNVRAPRKLTRAELNKIQELAFQHYNNMQTDDTDDEEKTREDDSLREMKQQDMNIW